MRCRDSLLQRHRGRREEKIQRISRYWYSLSFYLIISRADLWLTLGPVDLTKAMPYEQVNGVQNDNVPHGRNYYMRGAIQREYSATVAKQVSVFLHQCFGHHLQSNRFSIACAKYPTTTLESRSYSNFSHLRRSTACQTARPHSTFADWTTISCVSARGTRIRRRPKRAERKPHMQLQMFWPSRKGGVVRRLCERTEIMVCLMHYIEQS